MQFSVSRLLLCIVSLVCTSSCATWATTAPKAEVRGCVQLVGARPDPPDCVVVELHRFLPGMLVFPGSYVLKERQELSESGCFAFYVEVDERISIQTRDSDRILSGARADVVVQTLGNQISLVHRRYSPGGKEIVTEPMGSSCEMPLSERLNRARANSGTRD